MLVRKNSVFPLRSDRVSTYARMCDMREFRGGSRKLDSSSSIDKCTGGGGKNWSVVQRCTRTEICNKGNLRRQLAVSTGVTVHLKNIIILYYYIVLIGFQGFEVPQILRYNYYLMCVTHIDRFILKCSEAWVGTC